MLHTCTLYKKEFKAKAKIHPYCSKDCFNARNRHLKNLKCLICGTGLITYPNWIKRGGGKFCSIKCRNISQEKKVEKVCEYCGIDFKINTAQNKYNASKYCSPKCSQLASRGKERPSIQGEKAPNWRGGLSVEPYPSSFNDFLKEKLGCHRAFQKRNTSRLSRSVFFLKSTHASC